MPIYQTASYVFEDTQHAADLFDLNRFGNTYTRIVNPTTAAFEERVASLEGGVGALATASGLGATAIAVLTLSGQGDEIVSSANLYGGTHNQLAIQFPRFGITTRVRRPRRPRRGAGAPSPTRTTLLYAETIGNPRIDVLDIAGWAQIAADAGLPLMIDNTFATPYLCRPVRARRAPRGALGDEVHRRARHVDRRRDRRLRRVRLGQRAGSPASPSRRRATAACASTRRSATSRSS